MQSIATFPIPLLGLEFPHAFAAAHAVSSGKPHDHRQRERESQSAQRMPPARFYLTRGSPKM